MNLLMSLYIVALFVALTPGILLRLPSGGSKIKVAAFHAVVFAVIFYLTAKVVSRATMSEGFQVRGPADLTMFQDLQLSLLNQNNSINSGIKEIEGTKSISGPGKKLVISKYNNLIQTTNEIVDKLQSIFKDRVNSLNSIPNVLNDEKLSKSDKAALIAAFGPPPPILSLPPKPKAVAPGPMAPGPMGPGLGPGPRPGPN